MCFVGCIGAIHTRCHKHTCIGYCVETHTYGRYQVDSSHATQRVFATRHVLWASLLAQTQKHKMSLASARVWLHGRDTSRVQSVMCVSEGSLDSSAIEHGLLGVGVS